MPRMAAEITNAFLGFASISRDVITRGLRDYNNRIDIPSLSLYENFRSHVPAGGNVAYFKVSGSMAPELASTAGTIRHNADGDPFMVSSGGHNALDYGVLLHYPGTFYLFARSHSGSHSEEIIIWLIINYMKIDAAKNIRPTVLEIFSEYRPCGDDPANCESIIKQLISYTNVESVKVNFAEPYPTKTETKIESAWRGIHEKELRKKARTSRREGVAKKKINAKTEKPDWKS